MNKIQQIILEVLNDEQKKIVDGWTKNPKNHEFSNDFFGYHIVENKIVNLNKYSR